MLSETDAKRQITSKVNINLDLGVKKVFEISKILFFVYPHAERVKTMSTNHMEIRPYVCMEGASRQIGAGYLL